MRENGFKDGATRRFPRIRGLDGAVPHARPSHLPRLAHPVGTDRYRYLTVQTRSAYSRGHKTWKYMTSRFEQCNGVANWVDVVGLISGIDNGVD